MNNKLLKEIERAKQHLIIVEGKKDCRALEKLGFDNIFVIHETGKSFPEKIEQIQEIAGRDKVCILTDFDKKGKKLYLLLKSKFSELGIRMDNTLRGFLLKEKISHIEGLYKFLQHQNRNNYEKHKNNKNRKNKHKKHR